MRSAGQILLNRADGKRYRASCGSGCEPCRAESCEGALEIIFPSRPKSPDVPPPCERLGHKQEPEPCECSFSPRNLIT
eukprot:598896-Rhodomonas_salina.1